MYTYVLIITYILTRFHEGKRARIPTKFGILPYYYQKPTLCAQQRDFLLVLYFLSNSSVPAQNLTSLAKLPNLWDWQNFHNEISQRILKRAKLQKFTWVWLFWSIRSKRFWKGPDVHRKLVLEQGSCNSVPEPTHWIQSNWLNPVSYVLARRTVKRVRLGWNLKCRFLCSYVAIFQVVNII